MNLASRNSCTASHRGSFALSILVIVLAFLPAAGEAWSLEGCQNSGATTVYLVRHAEKDVAMF